MHRIRLAVKENVLRNPLAVQEDDYTSYLLNDGKGWVYEIDSQVKGFAIVDLKNCDVWALFVDPLCEGRGIGSSLHDRMMTWYFGQTDTALHVGTGAGTKAEQFYRKRGWEEVGKESNGDLTFIIRQKPLHLLS